MKRNVVVICHVSQYKTTNSCQEVLVIPKYTNLTKKMLNFVTIAQVDEKYNT